MKNRLSKFWDEQARWSEKTFGATAVRGPIGPLKHLAKEVKECIDDPTDIIEYADLLFLVLDATRRAGFTCDDLLSAAEKKLAINKKRVWPKPTSSDEPVEHDRSEEGDISFPFGNNAEPGDEEYIEEPYRCESCLKDRLEGTPCDVSKCLCSCHRKQKVAPIIIKGNQRGGKTAAMTKAVSKKRKK